MDTLKVVERLQIIVVCGLISFALGGAVSNQRVAAEQSDAGSSCRVPRDEAERAQCAEWERRILDGTVFMDFSLQCGDRGMPHVPTHATIVDERTLLTHDHFDPLADPRCAVATLEIASLRGDLHLILKEAAVLAELARQLHPAEFSRSSQSRLLSFPSPLFTPTSGLSFASFAALPAADTPAAWGEMAVINWQGLLGTTRIQWLRPLWFEPRGGALGLVVDAAVEVGASGGGAFRVTPSGIAHVGNTWGTWREDDTTIIALNPAATGR